MNSIRNYVRELYDTSNAAEADEMSKVKFSVTVDGETNSALNYLANMLKVSRASLASDLLERAVKEAEAELGLNRYDFESPYGKKIRKENTGYFVDGKKVSKKEYEECEATGNYKIRWQSGFDNELKEEEENNG